MVLDGCSATAGGGVRASPCPRRCDSTGATAPWPRPHRQRVSGSLSLHRQGCARLAGAIGYRRLSRDVKDDLAVFCRKPSGPARASVSPTTGTVASRPSTDLTGRKSTRASPQLSSMALVLRVKSGDRCDPLHRIAAVSLELSHHSVNSPLCPVAIGQSRWRRFAQPADRRHRGHRFAD